jgi:hypothetical protein
MSADERSGVGGGRVRSAGCSCGALTLKVKGEPLRINACSCHQCQRRSGSAFTYTAFFPEAALVSIEGEYKTWRGSSDAGRYQDVSFCPVCGTSVFSRLEALPGAIAIGIGCFNDRDFAAPRQLYWSSKKHHWLRLPDIEEIEAQ